MIDDAGRCSSASVCSHRVVRWGAMAVGAFEILRGGYLSLRRG